MLEFLRQINIIQLFECSVKNGQNIDEISLFLICELFQKIREPIINRLG